MSNDAAPAREGFKIMDTLPGNGPWELRAFTTYEGMQTVIAISADQEPRFYRDGKLIQVGLTVMP